jgi:DNA primase
MFPIIDVSGNVIAFGGRVMDGSLPKYKNSSDTPIYNKRRNVYALNFAKDACSEELILCEGYMDVIAVHAAGFTNAVATLGTAITPEHARLMKRYTKRVVISYDMDEAGRNAADKAMRMLEEVGLEVRLLKMDGAKDPDEFIRNFGAARFKSILEGSSSKFDYNMERVLAKYVLSIPQDKIDAAKELCKLISEVYSEAERDIYIRTVAKKLDTSPTAIRNDVDRLIRRSKSEGNKKDVQGVRLSSLGYADKVNPDYVKMPAVARCEEAVLGLLLRYPHYVQMVKDGSVSLTAEDFLTEFNKRVYLTLIGSEDGTFRQEEYTPDEVGRVTKMKVERMQLAENGETVLRDCIENLKNAVQKKQQQTAVVSPEDLARLLEKKRSGQT